MSVLFVWGFGKNGELGLVKKEPISKILVPQAIPLRNVVEISTGTNTSFAITGCSVVGA
jgi:hypothetical protein